MCILCGMARPKREGYTRRNIMSNDAQWAEINGTKQKPGMLPYEGIKDYSAFLEAGAARLIEEIKAKRKAGKK